MNILKTKLHKSVESAPYRFDFYLDEKNIRKGRVDGTYLRIRTTGAGGTWELSIPGSAHAYGYLLAAAEQGLTEQLRNYARLIWSMSMLDTTDQQFDNDAWQVILKWQERKMNEGAENAKNVTDWQERADDALMREAIERGKPMSRQQRRRMERNARKEMKDIIKEDAGESAPQNQNQ